MKHPLYKSGLNQVGAYRAIQTIVRQSVLDFKLGSTTEWFVLSAVAHSQELISKELAKILSVEPPLLVVITDNLEKSGLIQKVPNRKDKRVKNLTITSKGKKLTAQIDLSIEKRLKDLLSGVTPKELASYNKVLETIVRNSEAK